MTIQGYVLEVDRVPFYAGPTLVSIHVFIGRYPELTKESSVIRPVAFEDSDALMGFVDMANSNLRNYRDPPVQRYRMVKGQRVANTAMCCRGHRLCSAIPGGDCTLEAREVHQRRNSEKVASLKKQLGAHLTDAEHEEREVLWE